MFLQSAKVGPFKSINTSQTVEIDEAVTALVGMNEAGKTVFLRALEKSNDAVGLALFNQVEDYPRKDLTAYQKRHKIKAEQVTELTYRLTDAEIIELNSEFYTELTPGFTFSVVHSYDNKKTISISLDEKSVVRALFVEAVLSSDATAVVKKATTLRAIPEALKDISLTAEDKVFLAAIEARIKKAEWDSVVKWEVWKWLEIRVPKFLYFGEYELLPSKMNLPDLARRVEQAKSDPKSLKPEHRAILALLRKADIPIEDLMKPGGYESHKAEIEGVSINLTDQIMKFWKQNEDLEVEVDVKAGLEDEPPYNSGHNLYLRIKNRRHRGMSTPFQQRSRGFIWFFSFLVWFNDVKHQLDTGRNVESNIILLLDEPGMSLHGLAQADFLHYIDELTKKHQVIYTTHSPFMVHSDRLLQVRVVEDQKEVGTIISDNVSGSDPRTIFPLQAALGWTIAQNLFISKRNLLVEGPSDLIYLKAVSAMLEAQGRAGLREDVTIVPTGGLDKVVTFVALLGASGLKLAVLHDYRKGSDQKLLDLVKQKIISPKAIFNASQFRDLTNIGTDGQATDTEDLFAPDLYLDYFNKAFTMSLNGSIITKRNLPQGDRIIDRLERHLKTKGIQVRPSDGFNHYTVASHFASHPPATLDEETLKRFEAMFSAVNSYFGD